LRVRGEERETAIASREGGKSQHRGKEDGEPHRERERKIP
jgi:hypothetical protein